MSYAKIITRDEYEQGKSEILWGDELAPRHRYDAWLRLVTDAPNFGAYAVADYVKITRVNRDGKDYQVTMESDESGEIRTCRMSLHGIVYTPGLDPDTGERGYLRNPPKDEFDDALDAWSKLDEENRIPREHKPVEPAEYKVMYMELPPPEHQD